LPFQPLTPAEEAVHVMVPVPVTTQVKVTEPPPAGKEVVLAASAVVNVGADPPPPVEGHQPSLELPVSATGSTVISPVDGLTVTVPVTGMRWYRKFPVVPSFSTKSPAAAAPERTVKTTTFKNVFIWYLTLTLES